MDKFNEYQLIKIKNARKNKIQIVKEILFNLIPFLIA